MAAVAHVEEPERPRLMDDAMQLQPKEEGHPVKVRKPYTITKQREKWTEQEHDKFLEALKLYGRSWRHIQEHIGTKTAVQIRSHAQKFFSKVVREPGAGHVIDIPPPRPKRKPLHPYPRKCANPNTSANQTSSQPKLAPVSPPSSGSDKDNGSPVSVLSALQSDASGSSVSNPSMGCTSPMSSDDGNEMVNREQVVPPKETEIDTSPKEMTQDNSDGDLSEEETLRETSLKLFGKTVIIPDPKKVCSSDGVGGGCEDDEKHIQEMKVCSSDGGGGGGRGGGCEDDEKHTQEMFQASSSDGGVATYAAPNGWLLPHHSFPFHGESGDAGFCPLHFWWPYYGFPASHPGGLCAGLHGEGTGESDTGKSPSAEPSSGNVQTVTPAAFEVVKDSIGEIQTRDSALSFELKPSVNSAFVPVKPSRSGSQSARGFVPYKRCKVE